MIIHSQTVANYQRFLKSKFSEIESVYYEYVDELEQKLGDLDLPGVELQTFPLSQFSWIKQWENGEISSTEAYEIMEYANLENAARSKITKRLKNYMIKYDVLTEYIKPTIVELENKCIEPMVKYLTILKKMFKKMAELDEDQIKLTWVQQFFKRDQPDSLVTEELTLNQSIRHIQAYIHEAAGQRFYLKDQIVVFDEEIGVDDRAIHWIFGPRQYMELIRSLFSIKDGLDEPEIAFLKNLIKDVDV